jgi:hypothetical protein
LITEDEVRVVGMEGLTIALLTAIGFRVLLPVIDMSVRRLGTASDAARVRSEEVATGVVEL